MAKLFQERIRTTYEFIDMADFFFKDEFEYDPDGVKKHFNAESKTILEKLIPRLELASQFDHAALEGIVRAFADELGIKPAKAIHPVRLATTGKTAGAGLFETLALLGKERTIARLKRAIAKI